MRSVLDGGWWEQLGAPLQLAYGRSNTTVTAAPPSGRWLPTLMQLLAQLLAPDGWDCRAAHNLELALKCQPAQGNHLTSNCSQHREGPKMYD